MSMASEVFKIKTKYLSSLDCGLRIGAWAPLSSSWVRTHNILNYTHTHHEIPNENRYDVC